MSTQRPTHESATALARRLREQFVAQIEGALVPLQQAIRARLAELVDNALSAKEMYELRDAILEFDQKGRNWVRGTGTAWRQAIAPPASAGHVRLEAASLALIGDDVVERKILSSRLALAIREKASWELNDLKMRMQHLEGDDALEGADVLRPEALSQIVVEHWDQAGLTREQWTMVHDIVQGGLADHVPKAYKAANEFLIGKGVLRDIDLSSRVRRKAAAPAGRRPEGEPPGFDPAEPPPDGAPGGQYPAGAAGYQGGGQGGYQGGYQGGGYQGGGQGGGHPPGRQPYRTSGPGGDQEGSPDGMSGGQYASRSGPGGRQGTHSGPHDTGGVPAQPGQAGGGVADETRMMTTRPALRGATGRGLGVIGQLKRFLRERVAGFDGGPVTSPSPALVAAISHEQATLRDTQQLRTSSDTGDMVYDDAAVQEVAVDLRRRTGELKKKAGTQTEKAIIEIVALMFQSILAEERIPPAIRVWFARLQMPVLRVAIAEPEFLDRSSIPLAS